jgi:hypothetical protein
MSAVPAHTPPRMQTLLQGMGRIPGQISARQTANCSPNGRTRLGGRVSRRALLALALLTLGLGALDINIGVAYAVNPPTIKKVTPDVGRGTGGTSVSINGRNFTEATSVKFGSTEAISFTLNSPTRITALSPAGSGTVDVTVTTPAGTNAPNVADHFTYLPFVTEVSPISGPVGGGTTVSITGVAFSGASVVKFGAIEASSFFVNSATSITAVSPVEAAAGRVPVTVTTPEGISPHSAKDTFNFTPTITKVSPSTGPPAGGTSVTISGTGFAVGQTATLIKFGPRRALSAKCATTTECTAVTPELLPEQRFWGTVRVSATVHGEVSPTTPADQFDYHGLYIRGLLDGEDVRLPNGTAPVWLRVSVAGPEDLKCYLYAVADIAANGEATDEIDAGYIGADYVRDNFDCNAWFGWFPALFKLRINFDETATIEGEGSMGVRTPYGCVYEAGGMSGRLLEGSRLELGVEAMFTLTRNEPQEHAENELFDVNSEIEFLEETAQTVEVKEELEKLRALKVKLEQQLAEAEQQCSKTSRVSMWVEGEQNEVEYVR